ncbi:MAG: hypothetical protein ACYCU8_13510 [Ferrimicrobium acidiphilum]
MSQPIRLSRGAHFQADAPKESPDWKPTTVGFDQIAQLCTSERPVAEVVVARDGLVPDRRGILGLNQVYAEISDLRQCAR